MAPGNIEDEAALAQMRLELGNIAYEVASLGKDANSSFNRTKKPSVPKTKPSAPQDESKSRIFASELGLMFQNAVFDDADSRGVKNLDINEHLILNDRILSKTLEFTTKSFQKKPTSRVTSHKPSAKLLQQPKFPKSLKAFKGPKSQNSHQSTKLSTAAKTYKPPTNLLRKLAGPVQYLCPLDKIASGGKSPTKTSSQSQSAILPHAELDPHGASRSILAPLLTPVSVQNVSVRFRRYQLAEMIDLKPNIKNSMSIELPSLTTKKSPNDFHVRYTFHELLAARIINPHVPRPSCAELVRQLRTANKVADTGKKVYVQNLPPLGAVHKNTLEVQISVPLFTEHVYDDWAGDELKSIPSYSGAFERLENSLHDCRVSDDPQFNISRHCMLFSEQISVIVEDESYTYHAVLEWVERRNGVVNSSLFLRHLSQIMYIDVMRVRRHLSILEATGLRLWFHNQANGLRARSLLSITLYFETEKMREEFASVLTRLQDAGERARDNWPSDAELTPVRRIISQEGLHANQTRILPGLPQATNTHLTEIDGDYSVDLLDDLQGFDSTSTSGFYHTPDLCDLIFDSAIPTSGIDLMDIEADQSELLTLNTQWQAISTSKNLARDPLLDEPIAPGNQSVETYLIQFEDESLGCGDTRLEPKLSLSPIMSVEVSFPVSAHCQCKARQIDNLSGRLKPTASDFQPRRLSNTTLPLMLRPTAPEFCPQQSHPDLMQASPNSEFRQFSPETLDFQPGLGISGVLQTSEVSPVQLQSMLSSYYQSQELSVSNHNVSGGSSSTSESWFSTLLDLDSPGRATNANEGVLSPGGSSL
ncbi:hypothetical protein Cpir12675_004635 [Ceratocystis pirilliformis]|uniref:Uncharacterized protein n=1 Tax=Ceratocystis pirilliformis TaxID=259994 RepID=A0ABR3YW98_9PEZI